MHFTLPWKDHVPQLLAGMYSDMLLFAREWPEMAIFYNGAKCGASAPDHAHLQAVRKCDIPLLDDGWRERVSENSEPLLMSGGDGIYVSDGYVVPLFEVRSGSVSGSKELLLRLLQAMPCVDGEAEPRMNVISYYEPGEGYVTIVVPRLQHRPACYSATGNSGRMVSPGTLDMAGLVVTPLEKDFVGIDADELLALLKEVAIGEEAVESIVENLVACHEDC